MEQGGKKTLCLPPTSGIMFYPPKFLQLLIHELRRDIYYRKVNHVPNNNEEVLSIRRKARLTSVLEKLISYQEYIALAKCTKTIECARKIKENILNDLHIKGPHR